MINKTITTILLILLPLIILSVSLRGMMGNPTVDELRKNEWRDDGPFELSPERGRYALTYSVAEYGTVQFPVDVARFVIPDLGYNNGNYVSLFAPALSFIVLPGYYLGKFFGAAQAGTFAAVSVFAMANFFLIYLLSIKLGSTKIIAVISSIVFLFATPAFPYAVDLYQHHITTFLILVSILLLTNYRGFITTSLVFFIYALGFTLDLPNLFLMLPIVISVVLMSINFETYKKSIRLNINLRNIAGIIGVIIPISLFLWFNKLSYGSPLTMLGSSEIISIKDIDSAGNPIFHEIIETENTSPYERNTGITAYFNSRLFVNGLYILLLSQDRGIVIFTPIILFGFLSLIWWQTTNQKQIVPILVSIIGANLVVYAMWGDPWGGWAFGSRYLIPSYAILAILISIVITRNKNRFIFIFLFWLILLYSLFVNTLGALTTNAMPPKVEAENLSNITGKKERYSWDRNWEFINSGKSKSLVYLTWAKNYINPIQYFYLVFGSIATISTLLVVITYLRKNEKQNI